MASDLGNSDMTSREPSKGGIGIILKTASTRLMTTAELKICFSIGETANFKNSLKIRANITLTKGPAMATSAISRLGLRKFAKLTGTGFAHPNTTVEFVAINNNGKMTRSEER